MPWIALSLFFSWLIFREFRSHSVDRAGYDGPDPTPIWKPYIALMATLALLCAWPPFNYWRIERLLSAKATQLAEFHVARVHCNTVFDTLFDPESLTIGHARPDNGEIVFQYPWCDTIMAYRAHPQRASRQELISLNVLTHESMHVRGELNESVTECQAVQRNIRAARLLGVPADIARTNARDYYEEIYKERVHAGSFQAAYFSEQCAPDKALDEHLADSTWSAP